MSQWSFGATMKIAFLTDPAGFRSSLMAGLIFD